MLTYLLTYLAWCLAGGKHSVNGTTTTGHDHGCLGRYRSTRGHPFLLAKSSLNEGGAFFIFVVQPTHAQDWSKDTFSQYLKNE